MFFGLSNLDCK